MKATLNYTRTTKFFTVEDGPIIETSPNRLRQGRFKIETLSLTYHEGKITNVFVRGKNVLPDGVTGKLYHDRTLLTSEFPDWLVEFIDTIHI